MADTAISESKRPNDPADFHSSIPQFEANLTNANFFHCSTYLQSLLCSPFLNLLLRFPFPPLSPSTPPVWFPRKNPNPIIIIIIILCFLGKIPVFEVGFLAIETWEGVAATRFLVGTRWLGIIWVTEDMKAEIMMRLCWVIVGLESGLEVPLSLYQCIANKEVKESTKMH